MRTSRQRRPDEDCIENGVQYFFWIDREGDQTSGLIRGEAENVGWRYEARPKSWWTGVPGNPFSRRPFVFEDSQGKEALRIQRESFLPPQFKIVRAGEIVGKISLRSLLRNRYRIDLVGGESWDFRMPLFTMRFSAESSSGAKVWVMLGPSKMQWNLLMSPGLDKPELLCALAFIHNHKWNWS